MKDKRAPRRKTRNLFRDASGVWHLDYYTPDGKRRRKIAGKTKAQADKLLRTLQVTVDRGEFLDAANSPTFAEFVPVFMERHGNHLVSYKKNGTLIARLKTYFGKTRLTSVTSSHIEAFRLQRLSEPSGRDGKTALSRTTVNRQIEILRSMFSKAVKWGYLSKNPAAAVQDYDEDNHREKFLSNEEASRLLKATKRSQSPILRPAVYLALQTGMRKGELLGLRWEDVNFEAGKILCRDTKSGLPRHVPMSRRARWVLNKLAAKNPLSPWVFQSTANDGTPAPARDTKTAWRTALRVSRIEGFRFHDLRHTFASHFTMKGGNIFALAEILGHSNPQMTLSRYTHLSPAFISDQRKIMDQTYNSTKP